jgi:nicotinate-nucleotide pyrophosphorylase (carboxylating)
VQKLNQVYIKSVVQNALKEDLRPRGDITTSLINSKNKIIKAKIVAKQDGIIAGLDFCKTAFKSVGREAIFLKKVSDGKKIKKNKIIAEIKAKAKTILTAERTALNFLNHASGIATITNQFVKKISKKTKICCTRKTTPNLRTLEKYAVKKGGGHNHRYNLSDEILIKDNHIRASNNLRDLVKKAIKTKKIITVEIENINQLKQVMGLKFKRILFDNMDSSQLKRCLKLCKNKYQTEYSGNATLKNIKQISKTGVNRISVGAITHSAKSFDTSLLFR